MEFDLEYLEYEGRGRGIAVADSEHGVGVPWDDWAEFTEDAIRSFPVFGAKAHHWNELQQDAFEFGREVLLVPEPDNEHDPDAVAVHDRSETHRVGYVPKEIAPSAAGWIAFGVRAFVAWESFDGDGYRVGLRLVLVSPDIADQFAAAAAQIRQQVVGDM